MVKYMVSYFVLVFFLSCKDKKLIIPPAKINGVKLNGYYYNFDAVSKNYDSFFIYENGICLETSSLATNIIELEKKIVSDYLDNKYHLKNKLGWGICRIENGLLIIEKWEPTEGGLKTSKSLFEIGSNKTLILKEFYYPPKMRKQVKNEVYTFKEFSPKPDSTNKWIN